MLLRWLRVGRERDDSLDSCDCRLLVSAVLLLLIVRSPVALVLVALVLVAQVDGHSVPCHPLVLSPWRGRFGSHISWCELYAGPRASSRSARNNRFPYFALPRGWQRHHRFLAYARFKHVKGTGDLTHLNLVGDEQLLADGTLLAAVEQCALGQHYGAATALLVHGADHMLHPCEVRRLVGGDTPDVAAPWVQENPA